jgi:glyoxylase-like metal-dependent hydrolase (beta-lactamase superfamily II)
LLKAGLSGAVALALAPCVRAAPAPRATTSALTPRVALIAGVGANVLALQGPDGPLLVDGGVAGRTDDLQHEIRGLDAKPVKCLINTHWHAEQVGANAALGARGATLLAHERSRQRLTHGYYVRADDRYVPPQPKSGQPVRGISTVERFTFGSETVECGPLLEAHTDGDLYVFLRDSNVLAVGDVAAPDRDPVIDWFGGGWLGGRLDALEKLIQLANDQTRIVPAQGPAVTRRELAAEHAALLPVFTRMAEMMRKGLSARDMLAGKVLAGDRQFADPARFVGDAFQSLWAHHNTLSPDIV